MKKLSRGAARRYARALLDVALEQKVTDDVRSELRGATALLASHEELRRSLAHPAVAAERKRAILDGVWGRGKARLSDLSLRLLGLLVERDRVALLPAIEEIYGTLHDEHRGVVAARAVTAAPLDAAQNKALTAALARVSGRDVELTAAVEPAVLGGLLVRMAGKVYDGTVRARLAALRDRLTGGAAH